MKPTIAVVPRRRLGRRNLTSSLRSERSITLSSDQLEEGLLEAGLARTQLHKGHPRLSGQAIEPGCERNRTLDAQASVLLPERKTVVLDDSCENGQLRPLLGTATSSDRPMLTSCAGPQKSARPSLRITSQSATCSTSARM